jgi:hypothetical protein
MALRVPMVLLAVLLPGYGQAAAETETAVLTLSCDGTHFYMGREGVGSKTWPITNMGLHVNLSERTITGFIVDARISKISETSIQFGKAHHEQNWLSGSIDRITGSVFASYVIKGLDIENNLKLLCKPTKRLF